MIFGIGDGLFVICAIFSLSGIICLVGSRTSISGVYYCLGLLLSITVLLIFVMSPKTSKILSTSNVVVATDPTFSLRLGMLALGGFLVLLSLIALFVFVVQPTVHATRIPDEPTEFYVNY